MRGRPKDDSTEEELDLLLKPLMDAISQNHGNMTKAAKQLGISRDMLKTRICTYRTRIWKRRMLSCRTSNRQ